MRGRLLVLLGVMASIAAPAAAGGEVPTCRDMKATIVGTPGDDKLVGTDGDDVIVGRAGEDFIKAGAGDDTICGNRNVDRLFGGSGDDLVKGGDGTDRLAGHAGNDLLILNRGPKGKGRATVPGGEIVGGPGNDVLRGTGRTAEDYEPGGGADRIIDEEGRPSRQDVLIFQRDTAGGVTVDLGEGTATGEGRDTFAGIDVIYATDDRDVITGDAKPTKFYGLRGNDIIDGRDDEDKIRGNRGNDHLVGGDGRDLLKGGRGKDFLDGGNAKDRCNRGETHRRCEVISDGS